MAAGQAVRGKAGAVADWVKRALAQLPAAPLNRLAATCAMHLDLEVLKRTGQPPGYSKSLVDELGGAPGEGSAGAGSLMQAARATIADVVASGEVMKPT